MMQKTSCLIALCFLITSCATTTADRIGDALVVTLSTRPGVKQRYLILPAVGKAKGSVLLFKGGQGQSPFIMIGQNYSLDGNFMVRTAPLFARRGFNAVIIDTPSDHAAGIGPAFRESPNHLRDIQAVVSNLADKGQTPIFLIGTSRGTHSVAYLAKEMNSDLIRGVVLTSSMEDITAGSTKYPLLFVHHLQDDCFVTQYAKALRTYQALSSPRKAFLTVLGGGPGHGPACGPYRKHGFIGMEASVVNTITVWLEGKPIPDEIGR